ncbi:hypothetical protein SELMODRAFT_423967 [Selaginella moellendorffii]|uniref:Protein kinase domain-containing protein n=1 Tax=Selaginella moellendorffii TaxID=88036 RepID=D8SND4_SELML|nr:hypothetical protein SELMODRAFT_423967 [Selaginella moellendorffii]
MAVLQVTKTIARNERILARKKRELGLQLLDLSNLYIWLPPEDNKSSLGRVSSTRVDRKQLERIEELDRMQGIPGLPFFRLFSENKEAFVRHLTAAGALEQRVTNEMVGSMKKDSYKRQVHFLVSYAEAIARARNVPIQVSRDSASVGRLLLDGFFHIGTSRSNVVDQKTEEPGYLLKVEEARGQLVVTGNALYLERTKYHGLDGKSEGSFFSHKDRAERQQGYSIGEHFLEIPVQSRMDQKVTVVITGIALYTETSLVFRVSCGSRVWWLKVGADVQRRAEGLSTLEPEWTWERWFQTEGYVFQSSTRRHRPAMLVRDAGVPLEKLLSSSSMTPPQVYEMSKQLYEVLQCCAQKGVYHGDVSLQNICCKDGTYSLIDWGLAYGTAFSKFVEAVDSAWPSLGVKTAMTGIPSWEFSSHWYFIGTRADDIISDLESLLYCCLKILNENLLPWSKAAESGSDDEVLELRRKCLPVLVAKKSGHLYEPLLARFKHLFQSIKT